jgi:hypothetical protein
VVVIGGLLSSVEPAHTVSHVSLQARPQSHPWVSPADEDEAVAAALASEGCDPPPRATDSFRGVARCAEDSHSRDTGGEMLPEASNVGGSACTVGGRVFLFGGGNASALASGKGPSDWLRAAPLCVFEKQDDELRLVEALTAPSEKMTAEHAALAEKMEADAKAAAAAAEAEAGSKTKGKKAAAEPAAEQPPVGPPPLLWPGARRWHVCVGVDGLSAESDEGKAVMDKIAAASKPADVDDKAGKGAKGKKPAAKDAAAAVTAAPEDKTLRAVPPPEAAMHGRVFVLGGEGPTASGGWEPVEDSLWVYDTEMCLWFNPAVKMDPVELAAVQEDARLIEEGDPSAPEAPGLDRGLPWVKAVAKCAGTAVPTEEAAASHDGPLPRSRMAATWVSEQRVIVVHGGWRGGDALADTWLLDVDTLLWRRLRVPPLPGPKVTSVPWKSEGSSPRPEDPKLKLQGLRPSGRCWHSAVWVPGIPQAYLRSDPVEAPSRVYRLAAPAPAEEPTKKGKDKGPKKAPAAAAAGAVPSEAEASEASTDARDPWSVAGRLVLVGGLIGTNRSLKLTQSVRSELQAAAAEAESSKPEDNATDLAAWANDVVLDQSVNERMVDQLWLWALDLSTGAWETLTVQDGLPLTTASKWCTCDPRDAVAYRPEPNWQQEVETSRPASRALCAALAERVRPIAVVVEAVVSSPHLEEGTVRVPRLVIAGGKVATPPATPGRLPRRTRASPAVWWLDLSPWRAEEEESARRKAAAEAFAAAPAKQGVASRRECERAPCKDGGVFTGTMVNGLREGEGTAEWKAPEDSWVALPVRFSGTWKRDCPKRGVLVWSDGVEDEGTFELVSVDGWVPSAPGGSMPCVFAMDQLPALSGAGKRTYLSEAGRPLEGWCRLGVELQRKQGAVFNGVFETGVEHGSGKLERPDGSWVRGDWVGGLCHGSGEERTAEGDEYSGEFSLGLRDGEGRVEYAAGGWYEGGWRCGFRAGPGEELTKELHKYRGKFLNGERNGLGHCMYADGGQYEGVWVKGEREGEGCMVWASGRTYTGGWKHDVPHGRGSGTFPSEHATFVGEWRKGAPHGRGRFEWRGGDPLVVTRVYQGAVESGQPHGPGMCAFSDGSVHQGLWAHGQPHGRGQLQVPFANALAQGVWEHGRLVGQVRIRVDESIQLPDMMEPSLTSTGDRETLKASHLAELKATLRGHIPSSSQPIVDAVKVLRGRTPKVPVACTASVSVDGSTIVPESLVIE